jgi:hypothetical protein
MTTEDVQGILLLGEEQRVLVALKSNSEEEMKRPQVLHSEFLL